MNILQLLTSGKDYIEIVKDLIEKLFIHEARKFKCKEDEISIMITRNKDGIKQINVFSFKENTYLRVIPDKEAQEIIMK